MAIDYFSQERWDEAAVRFRMSAEAYMKVIIYEHLGDVFGHEVILGHKNQNGDSLTRSHNLFYYELKNLCVDPCNNWIDANTNQVLDDIKSKSNGGAHDSNTVADRAAFVTQIYDCYDLSEGLTNELYAHIGQPVPDELQNAYRDIVVDSATISALRMSDMDYFLEQVDYFDKSSRYILVAPFSTQSLSEKLLRNLIGIRWSVIIDFNCRTKEPGGIYHSMQPTIDDNCTPILNRDGLSNMSKGTNGNVNWIYANGLSTLQGTVTSDIKAWIGMRMHHFLRDALTEFCKKSLSRIHIISLLDEPDYLAEIIHQFDGIIFAERDLVNFSVISDKAIVREDSLKLSRYGFDIKSYNFTLQSFLIHIGDFMQPEERHTILIPARNQQNETVMLDVTHLYSKFSANGISIIHHDIAAEGDADIKPIPAFYQGETITWKELEADIDVQRSRYDELRRKILDRLRGRQSQKFQLYHFAGAGGTTVSRRLAYDLRDEVPTIIINENVKGKTFNLIELLSMTVSRPMLAIVESSKVGNIDDLIAECNAKKRMVVFVYVERTLKRPQMVSQSFLDFISDKMHDVGEKSKFSYKVQLYNPSRSNDEWIKKTPYANCEVLDFSMSIAEKNYSRAALRSYINQYLKELSEPIAEFLAYVSLIYYYAQRSVPDMVFRKVLELAPEEPQSYRDLALVLAAAGRWQDAADMMMLAIVKKPDGRFRDVELIAITELNDIIVKAKRAGIEVKDVDSRLVHPLELDLRVTIGWDTDMSDMDLHTIDPTGEECFYQHRLTTNGGRNSFDITQGYGPEEFMVRNALNGDYRIRTHYYGQTAQKMIGPVTLYAEIVTDFGRPEEKSETLMFRLATRDEMVDVATVTTKGSKVTPKEPERRYPPKNPVIDDPPVVIMGGGAAPDVNRMYQVRANETLEDIAESQLGDRSRAQEIARENAGKLRDGQPVTGSIITLPPRNR